VRTCRPSASLRLKSKPDGAVFERRNAQTALIKPVDPTCPEFPDSSNTCWLFQLSGNSGQLPTQPSPHPQQLYLPLVRHQEAFLACGRSFRIVVHANADELALGIEPSDLFDRWY
jgi:hypothetical protein